MLILTTSDPFVKLIEEINLEGNQCKECIFIVKINNINSKKNFISSFTAVRVSDTRLNKQQRCYSCNLSVLHLRVQKKQFETLTFCNKRGIVWLTHSVIEEVIWDSVFSCMIRNFHQSDMISRISQTIPQIKHTRVKVKGKLFLMVIQNNTAR